MKDKNSLSVLKDYLNIADCKQPWSVYLFLEMWKSNGSWAFSLDGKSLLDPCVTGRSLRLLYCSYPLSVHFLQLKHHSGGAWYRAIIACRKTADGKLVCVFHGGSGRKIIKTHTESLIRKKQGRTQHLKSCMCSYAAYTILVNHLASCCRQASFVSCSLWTVTFVIKQQELFSRTLCLNDLTTCLAILPPSGRCLRSF